MKLLIQRVHEASVTVDHQVVGAIQKGLCVFVGFTHGDSLKEIQWLTQKLCSLRLFPTPEKDSFEATIEEAKGSILLVSQFTLYGSCNKGRRPDFSQSMKADEARELFAQFVAYAQEHTNVPIETGQFQAHMDVQLINDGPVTISLEKHPEAT